MIASLLGAQVSENGFREDFETLADWKPVEASIAIMSDADNTSEQATSYVDYIEVSVR